MIPKATAYETDVKVLRERVNSLRSGSDLDILRRIAERGLRMAQDDHPQFVDIFQHMIDEIGRMRPNVEFSGTPAALSPEAPVDCRVGPGAQED